MLPSRQLLAPALILAAFAAGGALGLPPAGEVASPTTAPVFHLRLESVIHPVAARYLASGVAAAERAGAGLIVVEIDTPGGLSTSMHEMTRTLTNSRVPVVVYVAPRGARAASAGFFLLMAADVAAMAPDTNTGAAAAIDNNGQDLPETLRKKIEEDATAQIRALAERRGRNVDLAQAAIREARSFSATEALDGHLIDLVASDFDDLLRQLDGRTVARPGADPIRLATAGREVHPLLMTRFERALSVLVDPTLATLLLSLGGLALMIELYHPGAILPGVVGAICLVLGLAALSMLPFDHAGIVLLLLAFVFFALEIKVVSYGLLTVAGVICLVLGGMMLFDDPEPALRVSVQTLVGLAVVAVGVTGFLTFLVGRTLRQPALSGLAALRREPAEARTALAPSGKVFVHGELWNAWAAEPVGAGEPVEIVDMQNLTLEVRAVQAPERNDRS